MQNKSESVAKHKRKQSNKIAFCKFLVFRVDERWDLLLRFEIRCKWTQIDISLSVKCVNIIREKICKKAINHFIIYCNLLLLIYCSLLLIDCISARFGSSLVMLVPNNFATLQMKADAISMILKLKWKNLWTLLYLHELLCYLRQ